VIDIAVLIVVLAASASAGLLALRMVNALPASDEEHFVAALATGLGCASIVSLVLATAHALRPLPFAVAGTLALAAGGGSMVRALRSVRLPRGAFAWALVALCALLLVAESPTWFAPPVGGDQTKYHLAYARLFALEGGIVPTPWSFWGHQQWLQEFLYTLAYAVRGENLARLMNAVSGVLAAVALATLARRHLDRRLGVVVGALFFTLPITWSGMTRAGADMSVVLYAGLAVSALLDWASDARGADLRRAAVFAGFAGGAKVMGLLVPTLVGLGVLVVLVRQRTALGAAFGRALAFGMLALALLSPWYVRNWVERGDPLHPFGEGLFHARDWNPAAAAYLNVYYDQYRTEEAGKRSGKPYVGLQVLWFPWDLTMHPEAFENAKRQGQDVSPFALAFLPAIVLLERRRRVALAIAAIGVGYAAIIAVGAWAHPRYVLPGTALVLVAAAAGAEGLAGARVFPLIVALTLASNVTLISRLLRPMWPDQVRVALGRLDPNTFLGRYSDRFVFWHEANRAVPPDGRIVVLEKIPHPYYIDRPFVLLSYLEQGMVDYRTLEGPSALADTVRRLGATHVAVERSGLEAHGDPFEARVTELWRGYVGGLGRPVLEAGGYALYAVPDGTSRG